MKNIERKNHFTITGLALFLIVALGVVYIFSNYSDRKLEDFSAESNNIGANSDELFFDEGVSGNYNHDGIETTTKRNISLGISNIIMIIMVLIFNDIGRKLKERSISENSQVYVFRAKYFNVFKIILLALYIVSLYSITRK